MAANEAVARDRTPASERGAEVLVRPLTPADAAAIARLERDTYPIGMRAGARQLRRDLDEARWESASLGQGLFVDGELGGMLLVYYESDSRRLFDYFGVERPADLAGEECVYVADFVVRPEHSRYTVRLLKAVWTQSSAYHGVPVLGFSSRKALDRWEARRRAFRRFGYELAGTRRFEVAGPPHEIFLVRFEQRGVPEYRVERPTHMRVEVIKSEAGWQSLAPHWDELLRQTPEWTAFQSFEVQRLWWQHFRADSRPFIVVVREGARVRAIAPFCIRPTTYLGRPRRLLTLIGDHGEVDRPTILRRGEDHEAVAAIFAHLAAERQAWDSLLLYEQPRDGLVLRAARQHVAAEGLLEGLVPGPACPWADVQGSWEDFLRSKPAAFRKGLRRKLERLKKRGAVRFATADSWPEVADAFEQYLQVEARSWKPAAGQGVAKSAASLDYHRALLAALGPQGKLHVRVLSVDGRPIAATFGLLERGQFLSLHIAHDRDFDDCSPGVLLSAYELEEAYRRADYREYELLGGFLPNKLSWAPNVRETSQLYAYRPDPVLSLHHAWHFRIEPPLKALLKRLHLYTAAMALKRALRSMTAAPREQAERR